jgi:hypothetical protein
MVLLLVAWIHSLTTSWVAAQISGFIETGWGSNQSFTRPFNQRRKRKTKEKKIPRI